MTICVYCVRYIVDAPPAYKGDPYQRTAGRERMVATSSPRAAIDFVKSQPRPDDVAPRYFTATLHGPFHP